MRILHLASTLGGTRTAQHLALVAPELARFGVEQLVVNLGESLPFAARLGRESVRIEAVRFRGLFDIASVRKLRQLAADHRADVLHVWGNRAAMAANVLRVPFLKDHEIHVASDIHPIRGFSRTLVNRTRKCAVVVRDTVPLVDPGPHLPVTRESLGLPANGRVVVNVGGFDATSDQRSAVTAMDILKYPILDVCFAVVGNGPDFPDVQRLAKMIGRDDYRTHFLGTRGDVPAILARASLVVITHRTGGTVTAREARHAGVPVVAWDTPDMAAVVADGETGLLVPVGDRTAMASAMYRILTTPELAANLRAGASKPVLETTVESAANEWLKIYRSLGS